MKDLENTIVFTKPGGKYLDLLNMAKSNLQSSDGRQFIFFMCGIPDICRLDRDRDSNYEESFFDLDKSVDQIFDDIACKIQHVDEDLKQLGCKVVFCTICTMNFDKWNQCRLDQGKTSLLKFKDKYGVMQERLNNLLIMLNNSLLN